VFLALSPEQAAQVAARVRAAIAALCPAPGVHITLSIGLAHRTARTPGAGQPPPPATTGDQDSAELNGMVARSDAAMMAAKAAGRDRVCTAA